MILDCDLSGIEWRVAAFLSQDPVMIEEICNGDDIHTTNAIKFFGSSDYRQDCKIFNFRMIYGGSPYAFYMDPNMPNFSLPRWTEIVESFFDKYKILRKKHSEWCKEVYKYGRIINPTGRILVFHKHRKSDGSVGYSDPQIVNAPVQSLATADIAPLGMVVSNHRIRTANLPSQFIATVHDSNIYDCPDMDTTVATAKIVIKTFKDLPKLIEQYFGFKFNVPLTGEAKYGPNWGKLTKLEI